MNWGVGVGEGRTGSASWKFEGARTSSKLHPVWSVSKAHRTSVRGDDGSFFGWETQAHSLIWLRPSPKLPPLYLPSSPCSGQIKDSVLVLGLHRAKKPPATCLGNSLSSNSL